MNTQRALAARPDYPEALNNRGNALQQLKRHEEALASFEKADTPKAFAGAASAALDLCDWARTEKIAIEMERRIRAGEAMPPWTVLGYSEDEALQRRCAANVIASRFAVLPPPLAAKPYAHDRIRLAYVSSDVGHHPVATQVVELIEQHDRGRFEGIDERVIERRRLREVSVGDYVLSGGEPAALVLLDAIVRLVPGVMGEALSAAEESFEDGLLEHPHYTKPNIWEGLDIPQILLSGDHAAMARWKRQRREELTRNRRPDLWARKESGKI